MRYSAEWQGSSDMIITLYIEKKWYKPLSKDVEVKYIGYYTVWHRFPSFTRASLNRETLLSNVYHKEMYKRRHVENT